MRLDAVPYHVQRVVERMLPQRLGEVDERIATPHVVHEDVDPPVPVANLPREVNTSSGLLWSHLAMPFTSA